MRRLREYTWEQIKELCEEYSKHGGDTPFEVGDVKELTLKDGKTYEIVFIGEENGQYALVFNFRDIVFSKGIDCSDECSSWADSGLRKYLNGDFISKYLPADFAEFLRPISKKTVATNGEVKTTQDKIFLPSETEVFGKARYSKTKPAFQYEYFKDWHNRVKGGLNSEESTSWWVRSHYVETYAIVAVALDGSVGYEDANIAIGVSPCFAL